MALEWLKDFLKERKQRVRYGTTLSEEMECKNGVPQGSILGPLLFILYINDLTINCKIAFINMYADDMVLSVSGFNINEILKDMNEELSRVGLWLCLNKLKLNVRKSKGMIIRGSKTVNNDESDMECMPQLKVGGEVIEMVDEYKYLGLIVDDKLYFKPHVNFIIKKIGKKVGYLRRISGKLTSWTRNMVYNSIIRPHFEYCATVFYQLGKNNIQRLQVLQNKAMRCVIRCRKLTPIRDMLEVLNWLSVNNNLVFLVLVFI